MKIWKYLKWGIIAGGLFFLVKKLKDFLDNNANKLLDFFNNQTIKYIDKANKEKQKALEMQKQIRKSKDKRKKIRDKYSKIISCILIFCLFTTSIIDAKYLVYDFEDKVWRDYGTITNYAKALEEEKQEFLENEKRLKFVVSKFSNAMVCYSNAWWWEKKKNEAMKKNWLEELWEDIDAPISALFVAIVCYLIHR